MILSTPSAAPLCRYFSLPQLLAQKKKKKHPQPFPGLAFKCQLVKRLALQFLAYQLMDSDPFWEFPVCAVPQWRVTDHHFLHPDLHHHTEVNVFMMLYNAVRSNVHMTTDMCSIIYGRHYISLGDSAGSQEGGRAGHTAQACSATPWPYRTSLHFRPALLRHQPCKATAGIGGGVWLPSIEADNDMGQSPTGGYYASQTPGVVHD